MGLRLKFNLVLLLVFALGMAVSAWVSHRLLDDNAKQETLRNAGLMMEAALSVRGYTVKQIKPLLAFQAPSNSLHANDAVAGFVVDKNGGRCQTVQRIADHRELCIC